VNEEMSKESFEHLSSLMDGELSRESGLFLTRRLASDEHMCDKWERYHLIRDCIRQPGSKKVVTGLCLDLKDKLESEGRPAVSPWINQRWLKPVSGLAIAASVALVAIVATAPQPSPAPGGEGAASKAAVQPFVSPNTMPLPLAPSSQPASFAPAEQNQSNRLNAYLLRHNQMARTAGRQGFVSFVPIVAATAASVETETTENSSNEEADSVQQVIENR
jgi:sigma-E factor negative regulatory protein RseA